MGYTIIVRTSADKLRREEWSWYFNDRNNQLILNEYTSRIRKTTRHRFNALSIIKWYARLDTRANTITTQEVPMDAGLEKEALQKFVDTIVFVKEKPSRPRRNW